MASWPAPYRHPSSCSEPATGATAWATAYTVLAPADLYKPIWEYDAKTLWRDLNAHFVYGTVTALAFRLLTRTATTRS